MSFVWGMSSWECLLGNIVGPAGLVSYICVEESDNKFELYLSPSLYYVSVNSVELKPVWKNLSEH